MGLLRLVRLVLFSFRDPSAQTPISSVNLTAESARLAKFSRFFTEETEAFCSSFSLRLRVSGGLGGV